MKSEKAKCSALQCSIVRCSTVQCGAVQYSAVQCSTVQYSTVQCTAVGHDGVQKVSHCNYSSTQHSTTQHSSSLYFTALCAVPVLEPEDPGCDREPLPARAAHCELHGLVWVPLHGYPAALRDDESD